MKAARDATLGRDLGLLEGAGLISLATSMPELEYIFRHALIHDAARSGRCRIDIPAVGDLTAGAMRPAHRGVSHEERRGSAPRA